MKKIFIIEDDVIIREELSKLLESYGYISSFSDDFKNIVATAIDSEADLILLDINLPFYDGYHVCREIRKVSELPIIVVTSSNDDMSELMSMNLGADDFVSKPYNIQILLARISAIIKRTSKSLDNHIISHLGLSLNLSKSSMSFEGKESELTKNELKILSILMINKNNIVSREDIMNELWQSDEFVDDNTLTVNINRIRNKLSAIGLGDFITTKRGQGYIV